MSTLALIVATTLAGGVLSVAAAALFALRARASDVPMLVSFAIGTLLAAALLEILPHALEAAPRPGLVTGIVLGGILAFFVLEKLLLWRHAHEGHGHAEGRVALMVIVGDSFHNLVDGVIIAGAFLADLELGVVTALAIIAHEVPQEVGDFLVLLHSGYSRRRAFAYNLLASGAMLAGGVAAYFALQGVREWIAPLLGVAAASMLYVAIADLIPGLHKRVEPRAAAAQVALILAGVATVWGVGRLAALLGPL
ncbi:MAG TPA: ZIP family metal transporter [Burkholderiales bacterium]|nr:ZIP family metal transporter [Burkholderiales bacterium]